MAHTMHAQDRNGRYQGMLNMTPNQMKRKKRQVGDPC
jgi:hypothetical protein